ncbi:hypothetical protein ACHAXT_010749 [Thalassiosira profunda]
MCNPRDVELGEPAVEDDGPFDTVALLKPHPSSSAAPSKSKGKRRAAARPSASERQDVSKPAVAPAADTGLGAALLDGLPPSQQMLLLSFLMFLFFGMHNVLQEAIVNLLHNAGLRGQSLMLGYAEVVGVLGFSYLERTHMTKEGGWDRKAPLSAYPLLTACLFASSSLSNLSLGYINFPTKVVFRSCKLVPTMLIATLVNRRVFKSYEYLCALSICAGLVLFALADYTLDPLQFVPAGLALVGGSVVADAILPNAQEHLFKAGSSRLEVTVYSNLFSFLGMTVVTLGNGSLVHFLRGVSGDSTLALYFAVYTVLSYASISCYMTLVKRFGGVTAVVLTTARKAMTILLSFLLFPKGFSWLYVYGSLLVLGAAMTAGICKKLGSRTKEEVNKGAYSLAYRPDGCGKKRKPASNDRDIEAPSPGDTVASDSPSESSPEAILERISRGAYV